jgi:hypothetical protein
MMPDIAAIIMVTLIAFAYALFAVIVALEIAEFARRKETVRKRHEKRRRVVHYQPLK